MRRELNFIKRTGRIFKGRLFFVYAQFLGIFLYTLFSGCSNAQENEDPNDGISIVTTTGMIADAVRNIVKDSAQVEALMGPGVDPHLYKATHGDLERLTEADVIFYNGLHLEGKMGEVLNKLGRIKQVIAVAESLDKSQIRTSPEFINATDPHVWFDVSLWKEVVGYIGEQLQEIDTAHAAYYRKNTIAYQERLDSLHLAVKEQIATIPEDQRILITAHDAFGYFGDAYTIEVKGLQGLSTLSEFGLRDISNLVDLIMDRNIKAVFIETSVSEKAIRAVVAGVRQRGKEIKIGGKLYSDAMGEKGTLEGTYIGMVNANVDIIVNALK